MLALTGSKRRSKGDFWGLIFVGVALTGIGIWHVAAGNAIEAQRDVAERAFTPAEMAAHSNEVINATTRASQDYGRSLRSLPWPPAPADVKVVDDQFRGRLDAVNRALAEFEVPATHAAAELYVGLRSLVNCLRKTNSAVEEIDKAVKAGVVQPDFPTWFARFDAHCAKARARLQSARAAFAGH